MDSQGNLVKTWKVREFENKWVWQSSKKMIHSVQWEKDVLSHEIVQAHQSLLIGATVKGKNLLLFKGNSQFFK